MSAYDTGLSAMVQFFLFMVQSYPPIEQ